MEFLMLRRRQHGALIIAAIILIVVVALMVVSLSFLTVANVKSGSDLAQSEGGQFAAQAGIQQATNLLSTGTSCASLPTASTAVGSASFAVSPTLNNPASTTVGGAGVNASATTIPATSTTGYASHGLIVIDGEQILYTGKTATSFTDAVRGYGGTTAAAHLAAATVRQNQCTVRSTGTSGLGQRVLESAVQTGPWSDFIDSGSVTVSNAAVNAIATLNTSLPTGNNVIIAIVRLTNTAAAAFDTIAVGNLQLRKGATTLDSNKYAIDVGGNGAVGAQVFPQKMYAFVFRDAGAAANPSYSVNARAGTANTLAEVKLLVINNPPNSSSQPSTTLGACAGATPPCINTAQTTILTHASTVQAGDNIVIATVQWDNTNGANRSIAIGALRLNRGATVLASNQFLITMARTARVNGNGSMLLIARDAGAPANPTYTVSAAVSNTNSVEMEAKLIVISGLGSAFLDNGSIAVNAASKPLGPLNTTLPALNNGASNVVIAATQFVTGNAARSIAAGAEALMFGGVSQSSNQSAISLCATGTGAECSDFATGLLWQQLLNPSANPSYDVQVTANSTAAPTLNGEAKILAIHLRPIADLVEIFP